MLRCGLGPPIPRLEGAAVEHRDITLTAADGNEFAAFAALAGLGDGAAVLILPDVRGLYASYEELALRFAERLRRDRNRHFGRTAGVGNRDDEFPYVDHVQETTFSGVAADAAAAVAHVRNGIPTRPVFAVGFCVGGSNAWHQAANGLGPAGAIGFYGHPNREFPTGATPLVERVAQMDCPILGSWEGMIPEFRRPRSIGTLRLSRPQGSSTRSSRIPARPTRSSIASSRSSPTSPPTPGRGCWSSSPPTADRHPRRLPGIGIT